MGSALAEIAIRGDNQQTNEMYERLISQQKEFTDDQRKSQGEMTQIMMQMFNKALDTNAQVASSFALGGQTGQAPAGGAPAGPASEPQRVVVCRRCLQESPVATKFCPNCGDTLMADTR